MGSTYFDETFVDSDKSLLSGPPTLFLGVMAAEIVVSTLAFVVGARAANWAGYALAAWATAVTAIAHRQVDRRRSRESSYVPEPWVGRAIAALLLVGLLVAAGHAFFVSQETRFA